MSTSAASAAFRRASSGERLAFPVEELPKVRPGPPIRCVFGTETEVGDVTDEDPTGRPGPEKLSRSTFPQILPMSAEGRGGLRAGIRGTLATDEERKKKENGRGG